MKEKKKKNLKRSCGVKDQVPVGLGPVLISDQFIIFFLSFFFFKEKEGGREKGEIIEKRQNLILRNNRGRMSVGPFG